MSEQDPWVKVHVGPVREVADLQLEFGAFGIDAHLVSADERDDGRAELLVAPEVHAKAGALIDRLRQSLIEEAREPVSDPEPAQVAELGRLIRKLFSILVGIPAVVVLGGPYLIRAAVLVPRPAHHRVTVGAILISSIAMALALFVLLRAMFF